MPQDPGSFVTQISCLPLSHWGPELVRNTILSPGSCFSTSRAPLPPHPPAPPHRLCITQYSAERWRVPVDPQFIRIHTSVQARGAGRVRPSGNFEWQLCLRKRYGVPVVAQRKRIYEDAGSIPGLTQWIRIQHCCELWCRSQTRLDPVLLWLWCKLAAVAPIQPLAWEFP